MSGMRVPSWCMHWLTTTEFNRHFSQRTGENHSLRYSHNFMRAPKVFSKVPRTSVTIVAVWVHYVRLRGPRVYILLTNCGCPRYFYRVCKAEFQSTVWIYHSIATRRCWLQTAKLETGNLVALQCARFSVHALDSSLADQNRYPWILRRGQI